MTSSLSELSVELEFATSEVGLSVVEAETATPAMNKIADTQVMIKPTFLGFFLIKFIINIIKPTIKPNKPTIDKNIAKPIINKHLTYSIFLLPLRAGRSSHQLN